MRSGRRCGRQDVVVHINALPRFVDSGAGQPADLPHRQDVDRVGPRVGLIVSTAVGNAVVRHRVSRRLRHVAGRLIADIDPGVDIVVRALPGAATATFEDLERQIESAFGKLRLRGHGSGRV